MNHPISLLALVALSSCALVKTGENEPLDPSVLASIVPGRTTAMDVTKLLGGPAEVVELGERSAYRYEHFLTKGAGLLLPPFILGTADTRADRIWVFFDAQQVVTHVGATFAGHRPQYALPWEDVYEDSDRLAADADRPGMGRTPTEGAK